MELTEDEFFQIYGRKCMHCTRNTILPYQYEWTCFSCGYKVIKRKNELTNSTKKNKLL